MAEVREKPTALERVLKIDAERAKLIDDAKKEAIDKANDAIAALNSLGFNYYLTTADAHPRPTKMIGTASAARTPKDADCPICKFKTLPLHDARSHRKQGTDKKPFTAEELESNNLIRAIT